MRGMLVVLLVLAGCSKPESSAPVEHSDATAPALGMPTSPPLEAGTVLQLKAVDLDGKPVPGMVPIVTRQANATDAPLASGAPSDANGYSATTVPVAERVYVRMWDPAFNRFANNYYEVEVGQEVPDDVLTIAMVESAALQATLLRSENTPAAYETVGLMMFHPVRGPWWPAEADTDAGGVARFPRVPAGKYMVRITTSTSGQVDVGDVVLPPGVPVDLGPLVLSP